MQTIHLSLYRIWTVFLLCLPSVFLYAQTIRILDSSQKVSLRGLSVVNDQVFWVSGSKGSVGLSHNGGQTIQWINVNGYEQRDFRDIEAFDNNTAIIMAIDSPAIILKTVNGGLSWINVFEDTRTGMFLDAMYFSDKKHGVVVGDPIDQHFYLAITKDGGNCWEPVSPTHAATADNGEALFAASGSNIIFSNKKTFFVTGGTTSHLIAGNKKIKIPLLQGKSSAGANAMDMAEDGRMIIVGGDFSIDTVSVDNCIITDDRGKNFKPPFHNPFGYKSSVSYVGNKTWISCGTSGVDISTDHGMSWKHVSDLRFHVVKKAKKGNKIILAGSQGKIGEISFP